MVEEHLKEEREHVDESFHHFVSMVAVPDPSRRAVRDNDGQ